MNAFSFNLNDFVFVWWALLYEAMPFVVFGAVLSGVLEVSVSRDTVARLFPKNRLVGIAVSAVVGLVFPMCECGIVPLARRLIRKGLPASCAVTYMLASPVINPLVIISTGIAFRTRGPSTVTGLRVGLAYLVAVLLGLVVWRVLGEGNVLLRSDNGGEDHQGEEARASGKMVAVLVHAASDFLLIGATLVFGAGLAALINSGFSRSAMEPFAANPWTAVGGMSVLAVALNLCSEADAFVAASFYAFPLAAKLAFLVLGPMVDIKLIAMYTTVFRPKAIVVIMGVTSLLVVFLCVSGYGRMPGTGSLGGP